MSITGRKLMTGPVVGTPKRSASQPHWKTATTAPNEAATGEQEADRRLDRHEDRPEDQQQEHQRQTHDHEGEREERIGEPVGDVDRDGGLPGDGDLRAGQRLDGGRPLADVLHELVRRIVLRPGVGDDRDDGVGRVLGAVAQQRGDRVRDAVETALELSRADRLSAEVHGDPLRERLRGVGVHALQQHDQGAVEARAEVLADQVVGLRCGVSSAAVELSGSASWSCGAGIAMTRSPRPPPARSAAAGG
jgi:hypothetical protein